MSTLINIVVGLMGVLALLSLVQTGLLYKISMSVGSLKARMTALERRIKKVEE